MAKIPTTEFCPTCEAETPKEVLAKSGRVQTRVYQDLDTGKYECAKGHVIDLAPVEIVPEPPVTVSTSPERRPAAMQSEHETSVAVEEPPQTYQSQIIPGSSKLRQGGAMEMTLIIPEQYVGPLESYCQGIGRTVEEFINEVVANGFENGWFV